MGRVRGPGLNAVGFADVDSDRDHGRAPTRDPTRSRPDSKGALRSHCTPGPVTTPSQLRTSTSESRFAGPGPRIAGTGPRSRVYSITVTYRRVCTPDIWRSIEANEAQCLRWRCIINGDPSSSHSPSSRTPVCGFSSVCSNRRVGIAGERRHHVRMPPSLLLAIVVLQAQWPSTTERRSLPSG